MGMESKPVPDPTLLTTAQLHREIDNARAIFDADIGALRARLDGYEIAQQQVASILVTRREHSLLNDKYESHYKLLSGELVKAERMLRIASDKSERSLQVALNASEKRVKESLVSQKEIIDASVKKLDDIGKIAVLHVTHEQLEVVIKNIRSDIGSTQQRQSFIGGQAAALVVFVALVIATIEVAFRVFGR